MNFSSSRRLAIALLSSASGALGTFVACGDSTDGNSPRADAGGFDGTTLGDATTPDGAVDSGSNVDAKADTTPACNLTYPITLADGGPFVVPTPYLQASDSPFRCDAPTYFYLGTFEGDGGLPPGVSGTLGDLTFPPGTLNALTDSVDGDDGVVDGGPDGATYPCERCNSWFNGSGGNGVEFTFDEAALGGLPTRAGLVWTDGAGGTTVTFEAYGADGGLIGAQDVPGIGDGSNFGTTAEDRFFGIIYDAGVKKLKMKSPGGGVEVDHLQYGR